MRKNLYKFLALTLAMGVMSTPIYASKPTCISSTSQSEVNNNSTVIEITGEENIREYLESMGEEYDPNLVCVYRTIYNNEEDEISPAFMVWTEYCIKNKNKSTYTDFTTILKQYNRPAGTVKISEGIEISNTFSGSSGVDAEVVSAELGFEVTESNTFTIEWESSYSYAIKLKVYPIYEKITGELWEDDVWDDDYIGTFTVKRAIGDDVRVYKQ